MRLGLESNNKKLDAAYKLKLLKVYNFVCFEIILMVTRSSSDYGGEKKGGGNN